MFRKVMQVDDQVIFRYFELLSRKTADEVRVLALAQAEGADPRKTKELFAIELIERLHSREAAEKAATEFAHIYAADAVPDDVPAHAIRTDGDTLWIAKALSSAGLVKSTGEGKRLVEQGGVEVDKVRVTDGNLQLARGQRYLVRVGSKNRRFAYITVE
jgi:tyrosyl-tRNA synthetase